MTNPCEECPAVRMASVVAKHPEDYCHRCGGPNISWFTPGAVWDPVMRPDGPDAPWRWHEIVCPQCFDELAGRRAWTLVPLTEDGEKWTSAEERAEVAARARGEALKDVLRILGTLVADPQVVGE